MVDPLRHSRSAELLADLQRLHELLAQPATVGGHSIPLLEDVVEPASQPAGNLQHLRPLLMQSAQGLLQEVIRDFSPQITAELEKRLLAHLEQLIREQEQIRLQEVQATNPRQP